MNDHDDEPTRDEALTTAQLARLRAVDPQDYTVLFLAYEAMLRPPREESEE